MKTLFFCKKTQDFEDESLNQNKEYTFVQVENDEFEDFSLIKESMKNDYDEIIFDLSLFRINIMKFFEELINIDFFNKWYSSGYYHVEHNQIRFNFLKDKL